MTESLRIGFVSMHTSPADLPGSGDAGGMNVVEYHQAFALAELGHRVDLITRRSDPGQADVVELSDRVRLLHLPAGPAASRYTVRHAGTSMFSAVWRALARQRPPSTGQRISHRRFAGSMGRRAWPAPNADTASCR